jgi:hypothetical protein
MVVEKNMSDYGDFTKKEVKIVEKELINMPDSAMKISELKRILSEKVNYKKLKQILIYLDDCNKIVLGSNGVTWIVNNSKKLQREIEKGISYENLLKKFGKSF